MPAGAEIATLGAGCFWCVEAVYKQLDGVHSVTSGYMGGHVDKPTYEQICTTDTGHAEVVQVVFDPKKISYQKVLAWFWKLHDPTTLNRQGNDAGPQYRSAIFFHSPSSRRSPKPPRRPPPPTSRPRSSPRSPRPRPSGPAEKYHQDYYFQNKTRNRYCRFVIEPKLKKLDLDH